MIAWLLRTFPWLAALLAYEAGKSSQSATDQATAEKETTDALVKRAQVDDQVRADPDAAARDELRRNWSKN